MISKIKSFLKRIFCKHNWVEIGYVPLNGEMMSVKVCVHCGKAKTKQEGLKVRKSNRKRHNKGIKFNF